MSPLILSRPEARAWLRSLGQQHLRLPRALDCPVLVLAPDGALWQVEAVITGAYRVYAYQVELTPAAAGGGGR